VVFEFLRKHGDENAIGACVAALDDSSEFVRDQAHRALRRITGEDFGYRPLASATRRSSAQWRWRMWWKKEQRFLKDLRRRARE